MPYQTGYIQGRGGKNEDDMLHEDDDHLQYAFHTAVHTLYHACTTRSKTNKTGTTATVTTVKAPEC